MKDGSQCKIMYPSIQQNDHQLQHLDRWKENPCDQILYGSVLGDVHLEYLFTCLWNQKVADTKWQKVSHIVSFISSTIIIISCFKVYFSKIAFYLLLDRSRKHFVAFENYKYLFESLAIQIWFQKHYTITYWWD